MGHHDHTQDHQQVDSEVTTTDVTSLINRVFGGMFGGNAVPGGLPHGHHSNFEGHKLNDMLDMVEHATPHHLTTAGEALWSARDAISDAAEELNGHITDVDWHGESGTSFREWGVGLVENTRALSEFAGNAGTQISVAGSGLASVQKSMPPRDTRADQKTVHELPAHKRVKGDPDYDAAVKVEGHRQEAINQMSRLASFYSVASGNLAKQKAPTFDIMPDVGVPKPVAYSSPDPGTERSGSDLGSVSRRGATDISTHGDASHHERSQLQVHGTIDELPHHAVRTEIDGAPPLGPTAPPVDTPPTPTPTTQGPTSNPLPFTNGMPHPNQSTISKAFGKSTPPPARGLVREGPGENRNANTSGRGLTNGMGRGQVNTGKPTGRTSSTGRMPMGRSGGVSGGTPRSTGPAKTSQAGAVRKGGVVGGKPSTAGQMKGTSGRVPRGTVIGGHQENSGRAQRAPGKVGQRGVIGAPKVPENKKQGTRRTPTAPEGVLGAPKERSTGPKGERAGFTSGGSGLVRGQEARRHESEHDTGNRGENGFLGHQEIDGVEPPRPQHRPPHAPPAND